MDLPKPEIFPLGDFAMTIILGNEISESVSDQVLAMYQFIQKNPLRGMVEAAPAYASLTVYFDPDFLYNNFSKDFAAQEWIMKEVKQFVANSNFVYEKNLVKKQIPVCYDPELGTDLSAIAASKNISEKEIIDLHISRSYRVYMLGFLPGFAYLGPVDEKLAQPRKSKPEKVAAGSIGIAGLQTGIYPTDCPGGWHIIGRTPLKLFDADKPEPALLQAGDEISFYPISKTEWRHWKQ